MEKTITFATDIQAVLFNCEIKGQLSDGAWENTVPHNHWECWCEATVLSGKTIGRNFYAVKSNYGLASQLLKDIGPSMLGLARLAKNLGFNHPVFANPGFNVNHYLDDGKVSPPTYSGEYAEKVRSVLGQYKVEIEKALMDDSYTMKDLKKDLAEISKTMKTEL